MTPATPQRGFDFAAPESAVPGRDPSSAIAVSALTTIARDILEGAFRPIWVRGEVTNFKAHRNGHWYFTLRDRMAQIRSVVWSKDTRAIPAPPDEGMQIAAFGNLSVYPPKGEMQFVVRRMEAEGDGLWRKRLEQTRAKLEAEGLLRPDRKRPLPRYPRRVAVVTSPDGAALRDIVAVMKRRSPAVEIVVVPAAVQGDTAVMDLCRAIERVGRWGDADVVIVGRGGGSREDLWAFNDERVARAIAACALPVVSAVGHEMDITICDLVADVRAATPSAAAETVVRDDAELLAELRGIGARLGRARRPPAGRGEGGSPVARVCAAEPPGPRRGAQARAGRATGRPPARAQPARDARSRIRRRPRPRTDTPSRRSCVRPTTCRSTWCCGTDASAPG